MSKLNNAKVRPYISLANSKLGISIPTVNMPYAMSCRPDAPCFKECYAHRGNMGFKNFKNVTSENYQAYIENPIGFFKVIEYYLEMCPYKYFRWHSSGDIPDSQYLELMCKLARKCKRTTFLCFTKKHEIVNTYLNEHRKPSNLILVLSNWGDWVCPNPHNLPTSWVELKGKTCMIPNDANICNGYCGDCCNTKSSCWKLSKNQSVVFKQH